MECPAKWKKQESAIIPKVGDSLECSNYRTTALISHTSNTLLYMILSRHDKKKVETRLADGQAGFREGKSTADMFCALQILIEKVDVISTKILHVKGTMSL
ncbi:hypothetical protein RRG08_006084 [Elysia crispata]|uniref:Reverse transcriptase domain-containing protein n=1 Tax=Elysia crispata TaxID=231223 RepID=A0AAE1CSK8_9GAST|nr:hypothetical protein RRG08_006084 [Elysia crispata]